jgi:hypothetical protein
MDLTTPTLTATHFKSSQDKLVITNNALCIVQRARAQSRTGNFRVYGAAAASPGFQACWSDCVCEIQLPIFIYLEGFQVKLTK